MPKEKNFLRNYFNYFIKTKINISRNLYDFKEICDYWETKRFHDVKPELEKKWGTNSIHYILNEHTWVKNLSFYKIVRTYI